MKAYLFAAPLGILAFVKNVVHFVTGTVNIYTTIKTTGERESTDDSV